MRIAMGLVGTTFVLGGALFFFAAAAMRPDSEQRKLPLDGLVIGGGAALIGGVMLAGAIAG